MGWSELVSVEVASEWWCEIREKSADRTRHEGRGTVSEPKKKWLESQEVSGRRSDLGSQGVAFWKWRVEGSPGGSLWLLRSTSWVDTTPLSSPASPTVHVQSTTAIKPTPPHTHARAHTNT